MAAATHNDGGAPAGLPRNAAKASKAQYLVLLQHNLTLIERGVVHVEQRYTARVLRSLPYVRRQMEDNADVLALVVQEALSASRTSGQIERN